MDFCRQFALLMRTTLAPLQTQAFRPIGSTFAQRFLGSTMGCHLSGSAGSLVALAPLLTSRSVGSTLTLDPSGFAGLLLPPGSATVLCGTDFAPVFQDSALPRRSWPSVRPWVYISSALPGSHLSSSLHRFLHGSSLHCFHLGVPFCQPLQDQVCLWILVHFQNPLPSRGRDFAA